MYRVAHLLLTVLLLVLHWGCQRDPGSSEPKEVAQAGWEGFVEHLQSARDGLDRPSAFPPQPTDRNLAEGYRYLLGHLARVIEAETLQDPDFPSFQRSVRMLSKWTIDNSDTLYLKATIAPEGEYRIRGQVADTSEWRTGERGLPGPKAPRLVIFQTITAILGQTGDLAEMANCRNQTLESINSFDIEVDDDGRFELWVGPARPPNYEGAFLPTRKQMACTAPGGDGKIALREARYLSVREIFSDWENEESLELSIERVDKRGHSRPAPTAAEMAEAMIQIGKHVEAQIYFWNQLHELGLEVSGDRNQDGKRNQPINAMNQPSPPFIAGGVAGARQLYASGGFELTEDQALVIRVDDRGTDPHYIGFHLANLWGESLDQATYVSSLSGSQLEPAEDGARYYVIAHRDPGVPGWVDTTGLDKGTMTMRFVYREDPPVEGLATLETTLTTIDQVADHLPEGTASVTPEQRRAQIARRGAHIQRRWRQY